MKIVNIFLFIILLFSTAFSIDQQWYNEHNGILDRPDTTYVLTEDIHSPKWGFILAANHVRLLANNHNLFLNEQDTMNVYNGSFENGIDGWSLSDSSYINKGSILYLENTRASVWDGNYSLGIKCPSNSVVISDSLYSFAPNTMWNVSVESYNYIDNNLRMGIGLINSVGDTVHYAYLDYTTYNRGFMTNWVDFATKDTVEKYRIFLKVFGGTNVGSVFFDDVKIQTSHYHAIILGVDNSINQDNGVMYQNGDAYGKYFPSEQYTNTTIPSGCLVKDLNIIGNKSFIGYGVIGTYGSSDDTIYNCTINVNGIGSFNIKTDNAVKWRVSNCTLSNHATAGYGKRDYTGTMIGYIHSTGGRGSYGYFSSFDSNYCEGSIQSGIITTTRPDNTDNNITEYPLNRVFGNTIHINGRFSNDFAIHIIEGCGAAVYNNEVDNLGKNYGRGIYLGYIASTFGPKSFIKNNYVGVQQLPRDATYPFPGAFHAAYGIQLDDGVVGAEIAYNHIVAKSDTNWSGQFASCGFVCWDNVVSGINFHDNIIDAYGDSTSWVSCLGIGDLENGDINFQNNTFNTNDSWLRGMWNIDIFFNHNTWDYLDGVGKVKPWFPFQHYDYGGPMRIGFVDNVFPSDSARKLFENSRFIDYGNGVKFTETLALNSIWEQWWTTNINGNTPIQIIQLPDSIIYSGNTPMSLILRQFTDSTISANQIDQINYLYIIDGDTVTIKDTTTINLNIQISHLIGDINGDGVIDIWDVEKLLFHVLYNEPIAQLPEPVETVFTSYPDSVIWNDSIKEYINKINPNDPRNENWILSFSPIEHIFIINNDTLEADDYSHWLLNIFVRDSL